MTSKEKALFGMNVFWKDSKKFVIVEIDNFGIEKLAETDFFAAAILAFTAFCRDLPRKNLRLMQRTSKDSVHQVCYREGN